MKRIVATLTAVAVLAAAGLAGYYLGHRQPSAAAGHGAESKRKVLYWTDPMIPGLRSAKPGKSPMGMEMVPVYADRQAQGEGADVSVAPNVVQSLGVRTVPVRRGDLPHRIDTVGYVRYDQDTVTSINARAEGWVERLGPKAAGDMVHAGQVLYELFSPKLATAEREYLAALGGGRGLIAAAEQRLHALGVGADQIRRLRRTHTVEQRIARRAAGNAVVTALGVREGAYVTPQTRIMQLAALRDVWVRGEVEERQAALVKRGQHAELRFDAFPGETRDAVVDYVYPDLNPTTHTLQIRLRVPNPDGRLRPNMLARVRVLAAPRHDVLYIPNQALIRTGMGQRVILALGGGRFDVCPVEAGYESGDRVQILKGLVAGQRVVVSAQFMLDSEANVDAAALRLDAGKPRCTAPPAPAAARPAGPPGARVPRGVQERRS